MHADHDLPDEGRKRDGYQQRRIRIVRGRFQRRREGTEERRDLDRAQAHGVCGARQEDPEDEDRSLHQAIRTRMYQRPSGSGSPSESTRTSFVTLIHSLLSTSVTAFP